MCVCVCVRACVRVVNWGVNLRIRTRYLQYIGVIETYTFKHDILVQERLWVQENLTDSHAVFYLQDIGAELTCVFGDFIYSISVQS